MSSPRLRFGIGLLLAAAVVTACGEGVSGPAGPATVTATLSSTAVDGAILVRVTGPGFDNAPVAGNQGLLLYSRQASESELVVAAFGDIASGALFKLDIPDGRKVSSYAATVVQVADHGNDLRDDLSGYGITITVAQ